MKMISLVRLRIVECFCTRSISFRKNQAIREARMLDKMIKKKILNKKAANNVPIKLKQEVLSSAYDNEGTNRRTAALNKFYMEQLIELINSGSFATKVTELGIQFSKVKISACRSNVYVYWITSKPETPVSEIAEVLRDLKKDLQPQMGFLIPMRRIPFINFVKDLRLERQNIVENLLNVADFGKDYQPSSATKVVNPEASELQKADGEDVNLRQNVLGLDHAKIKEKVMQNVKRFQPINIQKNELEETGQYEHPGKLAVFSKKLFTSFYKRKLYLDKKFRTREYDDSCRVFHKPYDPEEEANKYWELINFKDLALEEQEEMEDCKDMYADDAEEEVEDDDDDDNDCKERDFGSNNLCYEDSNELGKVVKSNKNDNKEN